MNELALFDTSAWIQALRKNCDPAVKSVLEEALDEGRLVILPVIKVELLAGTRSDADFRRLKSRLDAIREIPLGQNAWEAVQELAYHLRRHGLEIPLVDTIILAGAKISGARLYHLDRHFELAKKHARVETRDLTAAARGN